MALGVSRSNVLIKKTRSSEWTDLRKSPPRTDDAELKDAIAFVVKHRATYGYRRVWARLKIDGRQINHKRVYRVLRDCCLDKVKSLWTPESTKAQWP